MSQVDHETYMKRCFDLACKGAGKVSPNPMVGAVLVHQGVIIGEGYHAYYGGAHAEVNAVSQVPEHLRHLIRDATMYVSLEPCSHYGKTPPCTDFILSNQIREVVICHKDPNPLVSGSGIMRLGEQGVQVTTGILEKEGRFINRAFIKNISTKKPYIILKWAESADGFIGKPDTRIGLSNPYSNILNHKWRSEIDAILIGTNTAMSDNPELTNRLYYGKSPVRVVFDRYLRLPSDGNIFQQKQKTIVITEKTAYPDNASLEYLQVKFDADLLENVLRRLFELKVGILLVEGGAEVLNSFLDQGYYDEVRVFKTPLFLTDGIRAPLFPAPPSETVPIDSDVLEVLYIKGY